METTVNVTNAYNPEILHNGEGGEPVLALPAGHQVFGLEKHLPAPLRRRGHVALESAPSFIRYVQDYADLERVCLFAQRADHQPVFIAVFDYHPKDGKAGWKEDRATYAPRFAVEWGRWCALNNKPLTQAALAEFIEDNLGQIVEPSGAQMLEMARTLEAKKSCHFRSSIRLHNGSFGVAYEEVVESKAGEKGELPVPDTFAIALPVFEGGPVYKLRVRLRHRIHEGKLGFHFEIVDAHLAVRQCAQEIVQQIEAGTKLKVFLGAP